MYPLIRVDKRIPDGSIWQARRAYVLPTVNGWTRAYGPTGTRWSNPLGGWTTEHEGISLFQPDRAFTVSCHGPRDAKSFYIDIAHRVRIGTALIEFIDLFLDVLIYPPRRVLEKDEHQLVLLPPELQRFTREARDEVRALIEAGDPLFDASSSYYAIPDEATVLRPAQDPLPL
jgi:hypothetical protein